jgi:hypothetical protein
MDDAAFTMKVMKNLQYGPIATVPNIIQVTGPHTVDGEPWYQIDLDYEAAQWLRELGDNRVIEIKDIDRCFNIPEDIYIMTKLKWA